MKKYTSKIENSSFKNSILELQNETTSWVSEIEFIKSEQYFCIEMIENHILKLCKGDRFSKAKLLLSSLVNEREYDKKIRITVREHRVNLALLIENIYLKKEENFRENHKLLQLEINNYIQSFKCIKEQVFELILLVLKTEKQNELLTR